MAHAPEIQDPDVYFSEWFFDIAPYHWNALGVSLTERVDKEKTQPLRAAKMQEGMTKKQATHFAIMHNVYTRSKTPNFNFIEGQMFWDKKRTEAIQITAQPAEAHIEAAHIYGDPSQYQQAYKLTNLQLAHWLKTGNRPHECKVPRFRVRSEILKYIILDASDPY